ncbi:hypothetical protein [Liquorilactobacillus hordei]|uniref:Uncharacterized protein n=1 Tax=Liquorilactobacillus hordei DSM 19519 TaxID=1423759 RepID=A0A0R1MWL2_9LACO|nr:hypothetical protein [Liquorilactobacillus hordei]KRL07976.1 hypothetical protein FC92_GL001045 [Liquorilactobacillus hordei DSM 19519]QYH51080.1 hypothetical protein G6O70_00530 [Liquorilactobacillus hordei DSM 19519]
MTEKFTEEKLNQRIFDLFTEANVIKSILPSGIVQNDVNGDYDKFRKTMLGVSREYFESDMDVTESKLKQWKDSVRELLTDILDHKVLDE